MTRSPCRPNGVRVADPAADLLRVALAVVGQMELADLLLVAAHPRDKMAALEDLLLAEAEPAAPAEAGLHPNHLLRNKLVWFEPG